MVRVAVMKRAKRKTAELARVEPAPGGEISHAAENTLRAAMRDVFDDAIAKAKEALASDAYDGDHESKKLVKRFAPKDLAGEARAFWVASFQESLYQLDVDARTSAILGD
jgi:hypothetical protein